MRMPVTKAVLAVRNCDVIVSGNWFVPVVAKFYVCKSQPLAEATKRRTLKRACDARKIAMEFC